MPLKMFESKFPFPSIEELRRMHPKETITENVYKSARDFYRMSLSSEATAFLEFLKSHEDDGEKKFAEFLIRQALHVG